MNYRGYIISASERSPSLLKVATEGQGGKIPDMLSGLHTSHSGVQYLIDKYLDTQKGKVNGKATPKSGD